MTVVRLSLLAKQDIEDIRSFTVEHWGREQWLRYFGALAAGFDRILENPDVGRLRPLIGQGVRSVPCQEYLIFYRSGRDGRPVVLRIIHERRNLAAQSCEDDLAW